MGGMQSEIAGDADAHCKVPSISEEDETILSAAIFLNYVNSEFNGDEKLQRKPIIQQLTQIVANGPPQRVAARPPQRVTVPQPQSISQPQRSSAPPPASTNNKRGAILPCHPSLKKWSTWRGCTSTCHRKGGWRKIATSGDANAWNDLASARQKFQTITHFGSPNLQQSVRR